MCPYVTINTTIRVNDIVDIIQPGEIGDLNFTVDLSEEYAAKNGLDIINSSFHTFTLIFTIENVSKPMTVSIAVLPGGEIVNDGLDWLTGATVAIPGTDAGVIPNWLITIIVIIIIVIVAAYFMKWTFKPAKGFQFQFNKKKKKPKLDTVDYGIILGGISMLIIAAVYLSGVFF